MVDFWKCDEYRIDRNHNTYTQTASRIKIKKILKVKQTHIISLIIKECEKED